MDSGQRHVAMYLMLSAEANGDPLTEMSNYLARFDRGHAGKDKDKDKDKDN